MAILVFSLQFVRPQLSPVLKAPVKPCPGCSMQVLSWRPQSSPVFEAPVKLTLNRVLSSLFSFLTKNYLMKRVCSNWRQYVTKEDNLSYFDLQHRQKYIFYCAFDQTCELKSNFVQPNVFGLIS